MWAVLIYALLHIIRIIRYFILTQYVISSLGDIIIIIMHLKKQKNKTKPKRSNNPKIKLNSDILIIIIGGLI